MNGIVSKIEQPYMTVEIGYVDCDWEGKEVDIELHRNKRSNSANALLWHCLSEIAAVLKADKWDIYILMLSRYGKFTTISINKNAFEDFKKSWREVEIIGEYENILDVNCYFGSSTFNSKEFSILLDGVISEMKELKLNIPTSEEMRRAIEEVERRENGPKQKGKVE